MTTVSRQGNTLRFENKPKPREGEGTDVKIRVPLEVLDMLDEVRVKTGLSRSRIMHEMITFAYEHTEIVGTEVNDE